jgi:PHD/YefM family antitoxin component YafN of YafNO toxin-antitoxin module
MPLRTKAVNGNEVRIPEPEPGEVTVVSRYGRERAVLVHPADFHRLDELDQLLSTASQLEPVAMSPDALRAHREEDTPSEPITDPALLAEIFGP